MKRKKDAEPQVTSEVALSADVVAGARMREALILQHEHTARCLREELMHFLAEKTGRDLAHGNWELDSGSGVLRRVGE